MSSTHSDLNPIPGLLAIVMEFVSRDQLLEALDAWQLDERKSLGEILVEQGALAEYRRLMMDSLMTEFLRRHQGEPNGSLETLDASTTLDASQTLVHAFAGGDETQPVASREALEPTTAGGASGESGRSSYRILADESRAFGRFRLIRFHDRGGLGEVFLARDDEVGREVALKQIRPDHADDAGDRVRFLLEAEVTGGLEHPGIIPIYGIGTQQDGRPFYAMRFIRGVSLHEAIKSFHSTAARGDAGDRQLELRKLLDRFLDVCDAIAYAHSRGVIHRDIKPKNIMLGPFGETLVVDWGLAKIVDRSEIADGVGEATLAPESRPLLEATMTGQKIGTPAYMPPEQAAGRPTEVGPRSDVYSLGATLYTLIAGRPPFRDGDVASVLQRIKAGDFEPPSKLTPWVDRALEAVCLKAMSVSGEDRYPSARALAEDIERWMADEPVSAWREPVSRRLKRWAKRRQTLVTSTGVAALLALFGLVYLGYEQRLRQSQRLTGALARVDALETAQTEALPLIVRQLAPDIELVRGRLARIGSESQPGHNFRLRLPAALALLTVNPEEANFLELFLLSEEAGPTEVLVVREALAESRRTTSAFFQRLLVKKNPRELDAHQFRAAGALALLDPAVAARKDLAEPLARKLVGENPLLLGKWSEVFRPVNRGLLEPLLAIFADTSRPELRDRAFRLLLEFVDRSENPSRPEDLAALLADADPDRANLVISKLEGSLDRARAVAALIPQLKDLVRFDVPRAARQGRIATALILLGEAERVWPLFIQRDDPSVRTELVHDLAMYRVDASKVVERIQTETDTSVRRALLLSLGGYSVGDLKPAVRQAFATDLLNRYQADPDPGVHAAINWLLRIHWELGKELDEADQKLRSRGPRPDRDWYVNGEGQTFSVVRGPVSFRMGSTRQVVPDLQPSEPEHSRRIPRSFAISSREVTIREYGRFLDSKPSGVVDNRADPLLRKLAPDCAAATMTWFEAARYCNWLSAQEGLGEDQWCYPKDFGPSSKLPEDLLDRTGYRLPTEAEWEFACRAGTTSAYPFGQAVAWLPKYAWFDKQSGMTMKRVGLLEPNDLGIFDPLGNAYEWMIDAHEPYPIGPSNEVVDALGNRNCTEDLVRVVRGGAYPLASSSLRSAFRSFGLKPSTRYPYFGFRLARTLRFPSGGGGSSGR
jgi:serine/threonine protein kinase/formylglycine-generating enzyme required for sulfatase activity